MEDKELADLRNSVRSIDKELAALFEKRLALSRSIAQCKSRRKFLYLTESGKLRT